MPSGGAAGQPAVVVLERLEEPLRAKWLQFLVETDKIRFEQAGDGRYSARVRVVRPSVLSRNGPEESLRRISAALQAVSLQEAQGKPLPAYARFCALLAEAAEDKDCYASAGGAAEGPKSQPRKRSVQWVERQVEEILAAKDASLRAEPDVDLPDKALSISNIFPVFVFEHLNERFGLRSLVEQAGWDLVYSLHKHRKQYKLVETFAQFLEESFDGDDLLFYLHAREVMVRHKLGGFDSPFERLSEVALFSSLVHSHADALKRDFALRAEGELTFPCNPHDVLLLATDNYHTVKKSAPSWTQPVAAISSPPPPPPTQSASAAPRSAIKHTSYVQRTHSTSPPSRQERPRSAGKTPATTGKTPTTTREEGGRRTLLREDDEDDRSLEEIVRVQARIKRQLDAVLNAPSEFASTPSRISPARLKAHASANKPPLQRPSRGPPPLPLIQTTRSPESSSVSSASPRSHLSYVSPAQKQISAIGAISGHSPRSTAPHQWSKGFFAADVPMISEVDIASVKSRGDVDDVSDTREALQTSTSSASANVHEPQDVGGDTPRIGTVSLGRILEDAIQNEAKLVETEDNDDDDDSEGVDDETTQEQSSTPAKPPPTTAKAPSPSASEGPSMALQRAVARLGSQMLDRFVLSLRAPGVGGGATNSPTYTARAALRRRAFEVFNKRALRITEQVQAASHSHNVQDCSSTYCPYAELRQLYQRVIRLHQAQKPLEGEVNDLASRIIGSSLVTREMDSLRETLIEESVQKEAED